MLWNFTEVEHMYDWQVEKKIYWNVIWKGVLKCSFEYHIWTKNKKNLHSSCLCVSSYVTFKHIPSVGGKDKQIRKREKDNLIAW